MRLTTAIATAAFLALSGCSILVMDRLPDDYWATKTPHCTESKAAPTVDVMLVALNALIIGGALSADSSEIGQSPGGIIAGAAIEGVIEAISAGLGYGWASECRRAHEEHDEWLSR